MLVFELHRAIDAGQAKGSDFRSLRLTQAGQQEEADPEQAGAWPDRILRCCSVGTVCAAILMLARLVKPLSRCLASAREKAE